MRAHILEDGQVRDVRGRSVESIARTHFGRDVEVRPEHSSEFEPTLIRWTVTRWVPQAEAHSVLGTIVEYRRGPGRPAVHPVPRSEKILLRLTAAEKQTLASMARQSGRSVNDEIIHRCGLGDGL